VGKGKDGKGGERRSDEERKERGETIEILSFGRKIGREGQGVEEGLFLEGLELGWLAF